MEPFLAEIRIFPHQWAPKGWAQCNGSLLPINQNQPLFALLGVAYGGNGQTTFALPDLRGRIPMHFGGGFDLAQRGGEQGHTLSINEMPAHTHVVNGTNNAGTENIPTNTRIMANVPADAYALQNPPTPINPASVPNVGGSQPHNNMSPYLTLNFCIALQGVFPTLN